MDILLPSVASIKGLDPLYVVNKGKLIAILESDAADAIVERMRVILLARKPALLVK